MRALDDVAFSLKSGDRIGLVGHNGAGKSTLLRVLAGVYTPDAGTVRVDGKISPLLNAAPGLDPEDNGYENIKTCGMFLGMSADELDAQAAGDRRVQRAWRVPRPADPHLLDRHGDAAVLCHRHGDRSRHPATR